MWITNRPRICSLRGRECVECPVIEGTCHTFIEIFRALVPENFPDRTRLWEQSCQFLETGLFNQILIRTKWNDLAGWSLAPLYVGYRIRTRTGPVFKNLDRCQSPEIFFFKRLTFPSNDFKSIDYLLLSFVPSRNIKNETCQLLKVSSLQIEFFAFQFCSMNKFQWWRKTLVYWCNLIKQSNLWYIQFRFRSFDHVGQHDCKNLSIKRLRINGCGANEKDSLV